MLVLHYAPRTSISWATWAPKTLNKAPLKLCEPASPHVCDDVWFGRRRAARLLFYSPSRNFLVNFQFRFSAIQSACDVRFLIWVSIISFVTSLSQWTGPTKLTEGSSRAKDTSQATTAPWCRMRGLVAQVRGLKVHTADSCAGLIWCQILRCLNPDRLVD